MRSPRGTKAAAAALAAFMAAASWGWCRTSPPAPSGPSSSEAQPPPARWTIVLCAPGYPGNTAQARPTMEAFAAAAGQAAGLNAGDLGAIYHEKEEDGVARLRQPGAAAALVPLAFYLKHRQDLKLSPRLMVEREGGVTERWSLAAARGRIASAGALAGWTILGQPGYAPAFVRGPLMEGWGELPASTTIAFLPGALSGLRRALAGEPVAVLLDPKGAAALPSLPGAEGLEIVHTSPPLPASVLALVASRMPDREAAALVAALQRLGGTASGAEALAAMQVARFVAADTTALERAARSHDQAAPRAGS